MRSLYDLSKKAEMLIKIHESDEERPHTLKLQFFPESFDDSYGTNWGTKEIPGGSHPLYYWSNGGERTISFTVNFYRESIKTIEELGIIGPSNVETLKSIDDYNIDINWAVRWLRDRMKPKYKNNGKVDPPQFLKLIFPETMRINSTTNKLNEMDCIMTGCDISYLKLFRDGTPKHATVALTFNEIVQTDGIIFIGR